MTATTHVGAPRRSSGRPGVRANDGEILQIRYSLDETPTSQHRAGMAGLVLLVQWLCRQRGSRRALHELVELDPQGLTLRLNKAGLAAIFDATYGAFRELRTFPFPIEGKEPVDIQVSGRTTGKLAGKPLYTYPVEVPRGAFLVEWDRSGADLWIRLWRDAAWAIIHSAGTSRGSYKARVDRHGPRAVMRDVEEAWARLLAGERPVGITSSSLLGARAITAEGVRFQDGSRQQFLLHFWPFVAQIYVPCAVSLRGTLKDVGYAIAIPDIADLVAFCADLEHAVKYRTSEDHAPAGYRPRGAMIDLSVQGGLEFFARLKRQIARREGLRPSSEALFGVDVFHMVRRKSWVDARGVGRIEPDARMLDEYARVRGIFWSPIFRRQRIANLIARKPWHFGYDDLAAKTAWNLTIGCDLFQHDARVMFEMETARMKEDERADRLPGIIYQFIGLYLRGRVASKYGLTYKQAKNDDGVAEYNACRQKVAREAFLAVRAHKNEDFFEYCAGTLGGVFQHLKEEDFVVLCQALGDEARRGEVRRYILLALCARG